MGLEGIGVFDGIVEGSMEFVTCDGIVEERLPGLGRNEGDLESIGMDGALVSRIGCKLGRTVLDIRDGIEVGATTGTI